MTIGTLVLFLSFLLTSLRYFIGAQFHLIDSRLLAMGGGVWFFDFIVITLEIVALILMGGVGSVTSSQGAALDFYWYLLLLLYIDVIWIILQWLLGVLMLSWRRQSLTWGWALINTSSIVALHMLLWVAPDPYQPGPLLILGFICVVAFILDVFLYDYYGVIRPKHRQ